MSCTSCTHCTCACTRARARTNDLILGPQRRHCGSQGANAKASIGLRARCALCWTACAGFVCARARCWAPCMRRWTECIPNRTRCARVWLHECRAATARQIEAAVRPRTHTSLGLPHHTPSSTLRTPFPAPPHSQLNTSHALSCPTTLPALHFTHTLLYSHNPTTILHTPSPAPPHSQLYTSHTLSCTATIPPLYFTRPLLPHHTPSSTSHTPSPAMPHSHIPREL